MRLWTCQPWSVVEKVVKDGSFVCNPKKSTYINDKIFREAYEWLIQQMIKKIGKSDYHAVYPIWAWYFVSGEIPDFTKWDYLGNSETDVWIELEIPEDRVVLTDYSMWHCVLNRSINYKANYINNISDEEWKRRTMEEDNYYYSLSREKRERYMKDSWERIFYKPGDTFVPPDIQASFWEIRKSDIVRVLTVLAE